MIPKILESRWFVDSAVYARQRIIELIASGRSLNASHSPFDRTEDGRTDFRGIDLRNLEINGILTENADFSFSKFNSSWIKGSRFKGVKFENCDFSEISDFENEYTDVEFSKSKFHRAALGYKGSSFTQCRFDYTAFSQAVFIRGEFDHCIFSNCKLKGCDFNASSFESCKFIGKLDSVWFRGGFALGSDELHFGKPKKNRMKNVSFEDAELVGVTFSNNCDLSTIKLPEQGIYHLFDHWNERLHWVRSSIDKWPKDQRDKVDLFVYVHSVHSKTQDWYLLNEEEIQHEYGQTVGKSIIDCLIRYPTHRSEKSGY